MDKSYLHVSQYLSARLLSVVMGRSCILSNSETSILAVKPHNHDIHIFPLLVLITLFYLYICVLRFHCCLEYRHNRPGMCASALIKRKLIPAYETERLSLYRPITSETYCF